MTQNSELLDGYWRMVAERRALQQRRDSGAKPPWTDDPILASVRFTNVYRADDRLSQYLIQNVLYDDDWDAQTSVFRAILFRCFNLSDTWEALLRGLGEEPTLSNWDADRYADIITEANRAGELPQIWTGAYMMCASKIYSHAEKHRNWLYLLRSFFKEGVHRVVPQAKRLGDIYSLLESFPLCGPFMAMQWTTDINYSTATTFSENSFVHPGPGAIRGLRKLGMPENSQSIAELFKMQFTAFEERGLEFRRLDGHRPLSWMDIQNTLCEFDKYCRVWRPDISNGATYNRIKNRFDASVAVTHDRYDYAYPPKWATEELA